MSVPYHVVIEPQEHDLYASVIDPSRLLTLPFSNLGKGSIPARNWVWEHSISLGAERHWILDDNIQTFYRYHDNQIIPIKTGTCFRVVEDLADRYQNVAMAGLQYEMFVLRKAAFPPLALNTRVYSCILLLNSAHHRWRGRYNEDTDLSLRFLKDGHCTILVNAFLAKKVATMRMKGGNTDQLYQKDGRLQMALSLQAQHPDVVKVSRKWGRWQHHVDYRPFKKNRLVPRPGVEIPEGVNEYGLELIELGQ
jgi:hypothetical protein